MKKFRCLSVFVLCFTLLLTACGGEKEASVDNVQSKDYVFREEPLDWLENTDNISNFTVVNGVLYIEENKFEYQDSEVEAPAARTVEEAAESEGEVTEEEATEAGTETSEEETQEDAAVAEIAVEAPMEPAMTAEVTRILSSYDMEGNQLSRVEIKMGENSGTGSFAADADGNLYTMEYEWATYTEDDMRDKCFLSAMTGEGEELWRIQLGADVPEEEYYWVNNMFLTDAGQIVLVSGLGIEVYSAADGSPVRNLEVDTEMGQVVPIRDGKFGLIGDSDSNTICTLDPATGEKGEPVELPFNRYNYSLKSGSGWDLYLVNGYGIEAYNIGDAQTTKLVDFIDSDLDLSNIWNLAVVSDTEMIVNYYSATQEKAVLSRLIKVPPEEVVDKEVITLGCYYLPGEVRQQVIAYNQGDHPCRIQIEDYSLYNTEEDYTLGQTRLNTDIVSGNVPDILVLDTSMPVQSYISKGVLTDLYELMEKDGTISKDDYMGNILDAFSQDGGLYQLVPSVYCMTLAGKTSLIGDKTGWTMEEMKALEATLGEEQTMFFEMTKTGFLQQYLWFCNEQLVNWETGECFFDTEGFLTVLEYANQFPEEIDYTIYEDESFWNEYETMFRREATVLQVFSMTGYQDYNRLKKGSFGDEVTLIGFPTESRNGSAFSYNNGLGISAQSDYQEEAWEFVKYFMGDEYQESLSYGFPIKKSALEKLEEKAQQKPYYLDENDQKVEYDETYYLNGVEIIIDPMTAEETAQITQFLGSVDQVVSYDNQLTEIVFEEADSYFSGQKSAKEAAEIIQSRVKIYVNENR
ncbi:MAG: extracellular solute-binding protein [Lachnospiraceae bacterium]|nr:extracellular solute-binding protein [Lachnospiraceae bacterium]